MCEIPGNYLSRGGGGGGGGGVCIYVYYMCMNINEDVWIVGQLVDAVNHVLACGVKIQHSYD